MKKNLLTLFAIAAALAVTISSCKKDDEDPEPYSNLLDTKTTELKVTIPRIEKSQTQDKGILVYVSVTDQDGEALAEFNQHNFKMSYLCEGADTVKIERITITPLDQKRGDIAAGITMDYSGSMSNSDIVNMENAVKQFVRLKESNDYLQLIKFASTVRVMNDFSNDTTVLIEAVDESASIGYMTAYFDAVYTGLENADTFTMQQSNMLPAVLAFTDGYENSSYTSLGELIEKSISTQIPVYTVGFGNVDEATMITLADTTGGRYFYTPSSDEVEELYNTISGQLRNIYSLSWQYVTITCDEITITVRVNYENANGLLTAVSSRSFSL